MGAADLGAFVTRADAEFTELVRASQPVRSSHVQLRDLTTALLECDQGIGGPIALDLLRVASVRRRVGRVAPGCRLRSGFAEDGPVAVSDLLRADGRDRSSIPIIVQQREDMAARFLGVQQHGTENGRRRPLEVWRQRCRCSRLA